MLSRKVYSNSHFDKLDLAHKDYQDSVFKDCSFESASLIDAKFNSALFKNCNFSNARVDGCNFFSAVFESCKLMGVNLSKARSLIGTTFNKCNFDFADLRGVDFSGQDLSNCSFNETDMSLANLERSVITDSRFMNVKLGGTKLLLTDFRGSELQGLSLKAHNLKGAIFSPQQLKMLAEEIGIQIIE